MVRNAKVGDRVRPISGGGYTISSGDDVLARFPAGAIGIVTGRYHNYVTVRTDHPDGVGAMNFLPAQLERVKGE